jgi:hypothetical protein
MLITRTENIPSAGGIGRLLFSYQRRVSAVLHDTVSFMSKSKRYQVGSWTTAGPWGTLATEHKIYIYIVRLLDPKSLRSTLF